jgi:SAM-dependent methyltransferase
VSQDFDRYRATYRRDVDRSVRFSGQDSDFFTDVKARLLLDATTRYQGPNERLDVLDVGCGVGVTDSFLKGRFGSLLGIDVSDGVVQEAATTNPWAGYRSYDGGRIPLDDGEVDVAFAICVVHHVDPPVRVGFLRDVARVVKPGGLVAIFEHNPFNPLTRLAVNRCDFDEGVVLARRGSTTSMLRSAGLEVVEHPYVLFFPFRGEVFRRVERLLGWLPLGAQYMVVCRKP